MYRRGWLLKTYNSGKLLTGRIKSGEKIENDDIDILHPVGMVAHVEPDDKMEIFTTDVGGDPSRRVISTVIGDREQHPQPDKNEAFFYAPNDKKVFMRFKKKQQQGGGGGGGGGARFLMGNGGIEPTAAQRDILKYGQLPGEFEGVEFWRANGGGGGGGGGQKKQTKESGREPGMHSDADDQKISSTTKNTNRLNADDGIGQKTNKNLTMDVGQNTQFEAQKHMRIGQHHFDTQGKNVYTKGVIFAHNHTLGSTNVSRGGGARAASASAPIGMPDMEDGSNEWTAEIFEGTVSLAGVSTQLDQFEMEQEQKNERQQEMNEQQAETNLDLEARVRRLEVLMGIRNA